MAKLAPMYAVKRKTGAVWRQISSGVWVKLSLGSNYSSTTQDIGYIGRNFFPHKQPTRFEVADSLSATEYFQQQMESVQ